MNWRDISSKRVIRSYSNFATWDSRLFLNDSQIELWGRQWKSDICSKFESTSSINFYEPLIMSLSMQWLSLQCCTQGTQTHLYSSIYMVDAPRVMGRCCAKDNDHVGQMLHEKWLQGTLKYILNSLPTLVWIMLCSRGSLRWQKSIVHALAWHNTCFQLIQYFRWFQVNAVGERIISSNWGILWCRWHKESNKKWACSNARWLFETTGTQGPQPQPFLKKWC